MVYLRQNSKEPPGHKILANSEADHSPSSSAEVKNAWSFTTTPLHVPVPSCVGWNKCTSLDLQWITYI